MNKHKFEKCILCGVRPAKDRVNFRCGQCESVVTGLKAKESAQRKESANRRKIDHYLIYRDLVVAAKKNGDGNYYCRPFYAVGDDVLKLPANKVIDLNFQVEGLERTQIINLRNAVLSAYAEHKKRVKVTK